MGEGPQRQLATPSSSQHDFLVFLEVLCTVKGMRATDRGAPLYTYLRISVTSEHYTFDLTRRAWWT